MVAVLLALRFVLELIGIAAVAYSGWRLAEGGVPGLIVGVAAAAALVAVWWALIAPRGRSPIPETLRPLLGSGVLLLAAVGLWLAGAPLAAAAFAVAIVVDTAALVLLGR